MSSEHHTDESNGKKSDGEKSSSGEPHIIMISEESDEEPSIEQTLEKTRELISSNRKNIESYTSGDRSYTVVEQEKILRRQVNNRLKGVLHDMEKNEKSYNRFSILFYSIHIILSIFVVISGVIISVQQALSECVNVLNIVLGAVSSSVGLLNILFKFQHKSVVNKNASYSLRNLIIEIKENKLKQLPLNHMIEFITFISRAHNNIILNTFSQNQNGTARFNPSTHQTIDIDPASITEE